MRPSALLVLALLVSLAVPVTAGATVVSPLDTTADTDTPVSPTTLPSTENPGAGLVPLAIAAGLVVLVALLGAVTLFGLYG